MPLDEGREVGLVGHVEEDCEDPDDEHDGVELDQVEPAEGMGDGHGEQGEEASEVAPDEYRPAPQAVDDHPGLEAHEDERRELDRLEQADLEGRGVEHVDGDEGKREDRDLTAERADGLATPQLQEVGRPQEAASHRGSFHHRSQARHRVDNGSELVDGSSLLAGPPRHLFPVEKVVTAVDLAQPTEADELRYRLVHPLTGGADHPRQLLLGNRQDEVVAVTCQLQ